MLPNEVAKQKLFVPKQHHGVNPGFTAVSPALPFTLAADLGPLCPGRARAAGAMLPFLLPTARAAGAMSGLY